MANDTSIHRINSDANTPVIRKKSNSETIDVSKRSFFEELLSLGQFESSLPNNSATPIASSSTAVVASEGDSNSATSENSTTSEAEDSSEPTSAQTAFAAQALPQQPLTTQPPIQASKDGASSRDNLAAKSKEEKVDVQKSDNSVAAKSLTKKELDSREKNVREQAATKTENVASIENDISTIQVEQGTSEKDGKSPSKGSTGTIKNKPSKDTQSTSNLAVSNSEVEQSSPDDKDLKRARADSKSKRSTEVSETANQNANQQNIAVNPSQARNKRAERLAQQATESDPDSDQRDQSTALALASTIEPPKSEKKPDQNLGSEGSEPNSSAPISSISPVIAPSTAFNASVSSTTTSQNIRPSAEGISAIATTALRGGIQTNATNTTFTGSVFNSARADQGKAEVARSNAGPNISAYQEAKLVQRVLRGVEQLANGGGQVRLRLHPPELGSLQMSLRMEAGQVFAKLEVENTTARDALLNNVQTLKDRMAEQGMQVASFEVEVRTDSSGLGNGGSNFQSDGRSGSESRSNNASSRFAQQNNNRLSPDPVPIERAAVWNRTNGSLDLTV